MNILIVDDNKNNRMVLRLLLEDYVEEKGIDAFKIDEAKDGLEAVKVFKKGKYEIVFMDIMMPNMDGIEATKLIRQSDNKVMIIAVSAVDDSERQRVILSNGAEDYVSKPVNSDIFMTRIENYITIVQARLHTKINEDGVNLFTKNIYSHYTKFSLSSEDSLSELWEYFLLELQYKCDNLSDVVRTIFLLGEIQLKLGIKGELYVEESEENQYFTIVNLKNVPNKIIELTLKKNNITGEYKKDDTKLSFKLSKEVVEAKIEENLLSTATVESQDDVMALEYTSVSLEVYDYIEEQDMMDLEEYAGRLNSIMLLVGGGDLEEEELEEMYTYIEKLGMVLSTYSEVYPISRALSDLAADISTHIDEFLENSEALGPLCFAFSKDLKNWIEQSFYTGAPSIDFMNDTIVANCQMIGSMLKMEEEQISTTDDIFDF